MGDPDPWDAYGRPDKLDDNEVPGRTVAPGSRGFGRLCKGSETRGMAPPAGRVPMASLGGGLRAALSRRPPPMEERQRALDWDPHSLAKRRKDQVCRPGYAVQALLAPHMHCGWPATVQRHQRRHQALLEWRYPDVQPLVLRQRGSVVRTFLYLSPGEERKLHRCQRVRRQL